jgi:hypothetical protein
VKKINGEMRERIARLSGVVVHWMGQSLENNRELLTRVDWVSFDRQQNFFSRPDIQAALMKRHEEGVHIEYGSLEPGGIVLPHKLLQTEKQSSTG